MHRRRRSIPVLLVLAILGVAAVLVGGLLVTMARSRDLFMPPLHGAVWREDMPVVVRLLAADPAAVHARAGTTASGRFNGATPLMVAAATGNQALVDLLLAHGADPTDIDALGHTAADHAAFHGQTPILPASPLR